MIKAAADASERFLLVLVLVIAAVGVAGPAPGRALAAGNGIDAALAVLGRAPIGPHGRRIAVLGDMLELGPDGPALHRGLVESVIANAVDLVFCCGPLMRALWEALPASRRGGYAEDAAALEAQVVPAIRAGDVVMVKGSLGSRMGPIVKALQRNYPRHETLEEVAAQG